MNPASWPQARLGMWKGHLSLPPTRTEVAFSEQRDLKSTRTDSGKFGEKHCSESSRSGSNFPAGGPSFPARPCCRDGAGCWVPRSEAIPRPPLCQHGELSSFRGKEAAGGCTHGGESQRREARDGGVLNGAVLLSASAPPRIVARRHRCVCAMSADVLVFYALCE